ncbi:MAG: hypothetical protein WC630_00580 [Candidatus Babeliales bacterium]|jgi:hypothetical protein
MDANMMKIIQKITLLCSACFTISVLSASLPDIEPQDAEDSTTIRIGKKVQNFKLILQREACVRALSDDLDQVVSLIRNIIGRLIIQEGLSQDLQADLLLDIEKLETDDLEHFCRYLALFNLREVEMPDVQTLQEKFGDIIPSDSDELLSNVIAQLAQWLGSKKIRMAALMLAVEYVLALVTWLEQRKHDVELSVEKRRIKLILTAIFKGDESTTAETFDAVIKVLNWKIVQKNPDIADEKSTEVVHKGMRKPICRICEISSCSIM